MDHRSHQPDDDAAAMPCAGGLLAGTLALMTCWAEPESSAQVSAGQQRALMARKIVSNLFFLREHPDLPSGLRLVVTKVHARWCSIAQAPAEHALSSAATGPAVVGALH